MCSRATAAFLLAAVLVGSSSGRTGAAHSKVLLTVPEALELAFPRCEVRRETVFLSPQQKERASKLAGTDVERGIVHPYVALRDGKVVGTAYFDTHRVRTLKETVMFVVDAQRRISRIEILAFAEPRDYMPRGNWYGQFLGRELNDELTLKRGIRGVTGATLTARATTSAARRVLAIHGVLLRDGESGLARGTEVGGTAR